MKNCPFQTSVKEQKLQIKRSLFNISRQDVAKERHITKPIPIFRCFETGYESVSCLFS